MRVHVLGLAHAPVHPNSCRDAFSVKAHNLCWMLRQCGHHVTLYGAPGSDAAVADEFVQCIPQDVYDANYGQDDRVRHVFDSGGQGWGKEDRAWRVFNTAVNAELVKRISGKEREAVMLTIGWIQIASCTQLPEGTEVIEAGIGYGGTVAHTRVFESHAWMHYTLGREKRGIQDGKTRDVVIPNSFDPANFPFSAEKEDYALFLGRIVPSKGYQLAVDACKKAGVRLLVVGQLPRDDKEARAAIEAIEKGGAEYRPSVGREERGQLLSRAKVLLCPTIYIGPFEGVAVEAELCGTPVIATNWGAFTETVKQGETGFLCYTVPEIATALGKIGDIRPEACRDWALSRYSREVVKDRYDWLVRTVLEKRDG